MERNVKAQNVTKAAGLALASLIVLLGMACGGGAGSDATTPGPVRLGVNYTDPTAAGVAPLVKMNRDLSKGDLLVFDVVANSTTQRSMGVVLNLQVDPSKIIAAEIPGTRDAEVQHVLEAPTASPGGFGAGTALAMRRDRADGYSLMVCSIRKPAPAVIASGTMMRFAFKIVGTPVEGVIRTQVMDGSGILDESGRLIAGTAPVGGRLEYVRQ